MSNATCMAIGRASVLMRMISACVAGARGHQDLEIRVGHHLGVVLEGIRDDLLLGGRQHVLSSAMLVNVSDRVASMIAPANARPKDSPNEPAAEFTPAASLTRSSSIGARV